MKITVDMIMEKDPCEVYNRSTVEKLFGENESLTLMQILDLEIPVGDRMWAVTRFLGDRSNRLFAADCAERCLAWIGNVELKKGTSELIGSVRMYANGEITYKQLAAYRASYMVAYREAYRETYSAADNEAYSAAYWAAYRAEYWEADNAAYWAVAADRAAEREWQINRIREYILEVEK